MSKRGYISRYMMLIKRLKGKPFSSFEELEQYIIRQLGNLRTQDDDLAMGFSKRTLQRDIREIRTLFGIDITYDRLRKGYHILNNTYDSSNFERMIEAFDVFNSLNVTQDTASYISFENRRPAGTENLHGLLHAIKNRFKVKFMYHKYWEGTVKLRTVDPYLLKEFRNRWYLLGIKTGENRIKSFALDRISGLEITGSMFSQIKNVDINELYQYAFGIISSDGELPQNVILSFSPLQGQYIKSLPLHWTQEIILENDQEVRIKIKVHLTHDLFMEIRSFGEDVTIIEPHSLRRKILSSFETSIRNYRED